MCIRDRDDGVGGLLVTRMQACVNRFWWVLGGRGHGVARVFSGRAWYRKGWVILVRVSGFKFQVSGFVRRFLLKKFWNRVENFTPSYTICLFLPVFGQNLVGQLGDLL